MITNNDNNHLNIIISIFIISIIFLIQKSIDLISEIIKKIITFGVIIVLIIVITEEFSIKLTYLFYLILTIYFLNMKIIIIKISIEEIIINSKIKINIDLIIWMIILMITIIKIII